jgi:hypothetical protein
MTTSDWIAIAALFASLLSILIGVYLYERDRGRIRAWAVLNYGDPGEGHRPVLDIRIVNIGRRPILLDWLMLDFARTGRHGTQLASTMPLKLNEGERFERTLSATEPSLFDYANDYALDIHIADTLGRVYRVKDAKKLLREYQQIYKEEIEAWKRI